MSKGDIPLEEHADFMGNLIHVGDAVIAVRVPDRTPQMYTGVVVAMKLTPATWGTGKMVPRIQVQPTGGYSTSSWHHGDYTSAKANGVPPKANWIQAENVLKYPPEIA